mgnify:CR=1 FL=1
MIMLKVVILSLGLIKQLAIKQLELAIAHPDISAVQRARFEARSKEVRDALIESGKRGNRSARASSGN